jgi:hypothetical protein
MIRATSEELLLDLPGRIAVVGNGPMNRELGAEIDGHESVVRMNNYVIEKLYTGKRITCRCTSGWVDVEHRPFAIEFSPFRADAPESVNLENFNGRNFWPVLTAESDVHALCPYVTRPSTGFALCVLLASLGLKFDAYGFDGFRGRATTHDGELERAVLPTLPGIVLP